jgi:4-diphosphocytidyl-2-C-methyl-D-erythritol kinase
LSGSLQDTAFAKINLALHVREKLADGYHRIETIYVFCEEGDPLSAEEAESLSLKLSGEFGPALGVADNLVTKAANALAEAAGGSRGASLHLQKRLPPASGLGGGSADAAAALRLLNELWGLHLPMERLEEIGRSVGADVAPCIRSQSARGVGRGDELEPVALDVAGTPVLLVNPRVELSTTEIFARWDGVDRGPLEDWRNGRNDLQAAATSLAPQIDGVLAWLMAQRGGWCVRMSGSGATCFALFDSEAARDHAAMAVPREWWSLPTRLR